MAVVERLAPTTPDMTARVVMIPSFAPNMMSGRYLRIVPRSPTEARSDCRCSWLGMVDILTGAGARAVVPVAGDGPDMRVGALLLQISHAKGC